MIEVWLLIVSILPQFYSKISGILKKIYKFPMLGVIGCDKNQLGCFSIFWENTTLISKVAI